MPQVIDSKTEKHSYNAFFSKENVETTLALIYTENASNLGIGYYSKFSGIKEGHVQGGPIAVSGNTTVIANPNPKVTVIISQFHNDIPNNQASLHVTITVDIPVLGKKTIYNQTLAGKYNSAN